MLDVRRDGSRLVVRGTLDAAHGRALLAAVARSAGDVHVDASRVDHVDGAGLTALAIARMQCRADGRAFDVTMPADAVRDLRARRIVRRLFAAREGQRTVRHLDGYRHDGM